MENRCCEVCDKCEKNYKFDSYLIGRRFLKTLTGDFSRRLSIPQKFMCNFKRELRKGVYLKGLGNCAWHIGLEKSEGNVFLQNDWQNFVEAHNLKKNDNLLFEYEGDSRFSVSMFDASHECEKEQSDFINFSIEEEREEEEEDSASTFPGNAPSPHATTHCISSSTSPGNIPENFPSSSPRNIPEIPLSPNIYQGRVSSRIRRAVKVGTTNPETVETSDNGNRPRKQNLSSKQPVANAGMNNAMELALSFQPSKPSFLANMTFYNIHTAFYLAIPKEFAKKYLPKIDSIAIFRLPRGEKKWKMKYSVTRTSFRFCGEWRGFVHDNSLKEGDVCVLELLGKEPVAMTVHIFQS